MTMMTIVREAKGPAEALFVLANTADREMVSYDTIAPARKSILRQSVSQSFRAQ